MAARVSKTEVAQHEEALFVRALVRFWSRDVVRLLAEAASLRAVVLDHLDRQYPDPDRRYHAAMLREELAPLLLRANGARDVILENDKGGTILSAEEARLLELVAESALNTAWSSGRHGADLRADVGALVRKIKGAMT